MTSQKRSAFCGTVPAAWLFRGLLLSAALWPQALLAVPMQEDGAPTSDQLRGAPRFLLASNGRYQPVDILRSPTLTRRITMSVSGVTLRAALDEVARRGGLQLLYADNVVRWDAPARLHASDITVAAALTDLLIDAGVDIVFTKSGAATLRPREVRAPAPVGVITGRVMDLERNEPVSEARVGIAGTRLGVVTDPAGRYTITSVPAGDVQVTAQRVGYVQQTKSVSVRDGAMTAVDFQLSKVVIRLDQVVTTATGEQRRREVGNVIGKVQADSLVRSGSITSVADLLTGRVSGLQVVIPGGFAGATPTIRIRGVNSISTSNDPLLVVDGVRMANTTTLAGAATQAGYGQSGGRFNDINPNDIESIEIVKGSSAATLYGTDAANGVLVIRTKRGVSGASRWTTFGEVGRANTSVDFLDNYYAWGKSPTGALRQCTLLAAASAACTVDSLTTFQPLTDPATSPLGTGTRTQLGAQVSGGVGIMSYFLSGSRDDETGIEQMPALEIARIRAERGGADIPDEQIRPNYARNTRLRGNFSAPLGDRLTMSAATGLILGTTSIPSNVVYLNGQFGRGFRDASDGWNMGIRPGEQMAVRNREDISHLTSSLTVNWTPQSWLTARTTTGVDLADTFLDALQRRDEGPLGATRIGRRQNTRSNLALYSVDASATARFEPVPQWSSRSTVGAQYNRRGDQFTSTTATGLLPGSETVTGAATVSGSERNQETVVAGVYAEQMVSWKDRLFLTGALRADGASAFGRGFKTALYPKLSGSWIAINDRTGILNSTRLRAAYGAAGVQPGATAALTIYNLLTVLTDGVNTSGAIPGAIGNADLKPERTNEFETGLDADLLYGRVSLELTYYHRVSQDALILYRLPSEVGVPSQWRNIGSVLNEGVEALATIRLLQGDKLGANLTITGSTNTNRIERLGFAQAIVASSGLNVEGYPIFSRFARPILSYADANGNGILEASEITTGPTPEYAGSSLPRKQLSVSPEVSLFRNRLRVSAQFDYRGDFAQYNHSEANRCGLAISDCKAVNDKSASLASQARAVALQTASLGSTSWGYYEDASFTRWRELAITAELPSRLTRWSRGNASVSLAARNLALFTNYSGADPEVISTPGATEGFDDNAAPPQSRIWLLRFTIGF
ncbi:MAG: TonB-dependent receptor [bacterium]